MTHISECWSYIHYYGTTPLVGIGIKNQEALAHKWHLVDKVNLAAEIFLPHLNHYTFLPYKLKSVFQKLLVFSILTK